MDIIALLRKLGILRIGGGSYKGKVGGEYATIDMDTSRGDKEAKGPSPSEKDGATGGR